MSRSARRGGRRLALALLLPWASALPARAQWTVDVSAGGAEYDPLAASVGAHSAMLGLRYAGMRWLELTAGVPLDSAGLPWAAGGLGGRWGTERAGLTLGVDVAGQAHAYRAPALDASGGGVVVEALPFVGWSGRGVRAEVRAGMQHYAHSFDGETGSRSLVETGARLGARPLAALALGAEVRHLRAEEDAYPFAGGSLGLSLPRGELFARAGRWLHDDLDDAVWEVGGRLFLDARTEVYARVEREAPDPLYWNDPHRSWTVGLSRSVGPVPLRQVLVPVVPATPEGGVEIRLPLSEAAAAPAVAGDFNGWTPTPMRRSGDAWVLTVSLEPGVYRYAFRRADGSWFLPASASNRVDDGFGGENAVLVVAPSGEG